jgi:hypothetical protein
MTSRGAILIARNNSQIDYVKQAIFSAKRIKKYLNIPVTLITDSVNLNEPVFDSIINLTNENAYTYRTYNDGIFSKKTLEFKNTSRRLVYDLSPYDETILLDTDFIVSDPMLNNCFSMSHDLMMYKNAVELSNWRDLSEFEYISDTGPEFYWATVVFFRKTPEVQEFFNLVKFIQENWNHYKIMFQMNTKIFRNDHAFSIAAHFMNDFTNGEFVKELPGTLFYTTDKDVLVSLKDDTFRFLIEDQKNGSYFLSKITGSSVHVMNKFSLNEIIDNDT